MLNFLGLRTYLELCQEGLNTLHATALKKSKLFESFTSTPKGIIEIFSGTTKNLKSKKDYTIILNRVIFIFEDISWSNLALSYRLGLNVRLNGGTVTKRFALNTQVRE